MAINYKSLYFSGIEVGTQNGDKLNTGILAEQVGEYKLKLSFLDQSISIAGEVEGSGELVFKTDGLNEKHEWVGQVFTPEGDLVEFYFDDVKYDAFHFKTNNVIEL